MVENIRDTAGPPERPPAHNDNRLYTPEEFALTKLQLERAQSALRSLEERVKPQNPRNFAVFAEGYQDQIDQLQWQIDDYLARQSAGAA